MIMFDNKWLGNLRKNIIIAFIYNSIVIGVVFVMEINTTDQSGQTVLLGIPFFSIPLMALHCGIVILDYIYYFVKGTKRSFKTFVAIILVVIGIAIVMYIVGVLLILTLLSILEKFGFSKPKPTWD